MRVQAGQCHEVREHLGETSIPSRNVVSGRWQISPIGQAPPSEIGRTELSGLSGAVRRWTNTILATLKASDGTFNVLNVSHQGGCNVSVRAATCG